MPSLDPKTGKPISGAEVRRRKMQRLEADRAREAPPDETGLSVCAPPESTAELVTWAASALAQVIHRAAQDRTIFLTEADQLRFIADGCAKLGMVRDKAAEQERIKKAAVRAGLAPDKNKPSAGAKSLAGIEKPPTARRA